MQRGKSKIIRKKKGAGKMRNNTRASSNLNNYKTSAVLLIFLFIDIYIYIYQVHHQLGSIVERDFEIFVWM